jgi:TolB-like protein
MRNRLLTLLSIAAMSLGLAACASIDASPTPQLFAARDWAVLPLDNLTDTPMAGLRAAAVAASVLSAGGVEGVQQYADDNSETLFQPASADLRAKSLAWARAQHAPYALTGSVIEWRYKAGVDGEPVVGLTLQLFDVDSGKVVWSASGHREGWGNDSLAGVASALERSLLAPLTDAAQGAAKRELKPSTASQMDAVPSH